MIADAIRDQAPALVVDSCWRVGPIALGMSEAAVRSRLGAPATRVVDTDGTTLIYAFPTRGRAIVANGRARLRLAALRFGDDRLVAIDNNPPTITPGGTCRGRPRPHPLADIALGRRTGPLLEFAGVSVGDAVSVLRRRFGQAPATNRSRDWDNYLPLPISFDVDGARIDGFTIARNDALVPFASGIRLVPRRDTANCRLIGLDFAPAAGG